MFCDLDLSDDQVKQISIDDARTFIRELKTHVGDLETIGDRESFEKFKKVKSRLEDIVAGFKNEEKALKSEYGITCIQ